MTATALDANVIARSQEITAAETTSIIYWNRAMAASEKVYPGITAFGNDCWSAGTAYEHTLSMYAGLQPDKTQWTPAQNGIIAALLANFVTAQGNVDAILGSSTKEHIRANNDQAAAFATILAGL